MIFEELRTDRLILRKITQETYDYIFETFSDHQIIEFLGLNSNQEFILEKEKYQNGLSTHNRKFLYFQLIDKTTGKIIGWCGFHTWYVDHHRAEIGYALSDDDYKGMGIMSEAITPIIEYGFEQMNLNRIEAFIGPDNFPSLNLIKKMNFRAEGQLRQHYVKNNRAEDSMVFSLLKTEFK
ncbi:GNAT family N-acetyltransferase [Dyadobacter sp. 3J3]|uniref:GNAT family N-acetyltransferase n=1 Tax=Dyadobacter sp. 3J3 TaxID=2606600 RepID=UPI00135AA061|nr:GNAT family protein [Dyadobacter sp. 3J3]